MSYLDELKKLKELFDDGAITPIEYERERSRILANGDGVFGITPSVPDYSTSYSPPPAVPNYNYSPPPTVSNYNYSPPPTAFNNNWGRTQTQFLDNWRTNAGLTILGIAINLILDRLVFSYDYASYGAAIAIAIIAIVYAIISIVYAAVVYPSLFTSSPKAQSANTISFLNGLFGYIIFGLIWNSNLTKGKKGISHIVFIICVIALNVLSFLAGLLL